MNLCAFSQSLGSVLFFSCVTVVGITTHESLTYLILSYYSSYTAMTAHLICFGLNQTSVTPSMQAFK